MATSRGKSIKYGWFKDKTTSKLVKFTQKLLNFTKLRGLLHFLPQLSNIFTQIYLPYLWHFATLCSIGVVVGGDGDTGECGDSGSGGDGGVFSSGCGCGCGGGGGDYIGCLSRVNWTALWHPILHPSLHLIPQIFQPQLFFTK